MEDICAYLYGIVESWCVSLMFRRVNSEIPNNDLICVQTLYQDDNLFVCVRLVGGNQSPYRYNISGGIQRICLRAQKKFKCATTNNTMWLYHYDMRGSMFIHIGKLDRLVKKKVFTRVVVECLAKATFVIRCGTHCWLLSYIGDFRKSRDVDLRMIE